MTFSVLFLRRPFENRTLAPSCFACSPLTSGRTVHPSTIGAVWGGLHACVTDIPSYHLGLAMHGGGSYFIFATFRYAATCLAAYIR